jgi:hypothetical protein
MPHCCRAESSLLYLWLKAVTVEPPIYRPDDRCFYQTYHHCKGDGDEFVPARRRRYLSVSYEIIPRHSPKPMRAAPGLSQ